jgi:hypothetical protein
MRSLRTNDVIERIGGLPPQLSQLSTRRQSSRLDDVRRWIVPRANGAYPQVRLYRFSVLVAGKATRHGVIAKMNSILPLVHQDREWGVAGGIGNSLSHHEPNTLACGRAKFLLHDEAAIEPVELHELNGTHHFLNDVLQFSLSPGCSQLFPKGFQVGVANTVGNVLNNLLEGP